MARGMTNAPPRLAGILAFIRGETVGGLVLMLAALVAVAWANSPAADVYEHILHLPVGVILGEATIRADLHFVVNDALMAVFFLLVGLEIRREMTEGQLASVQRAAAPGIAALGGMAAPALIYMTFAHGDRSAWPGWAIPTATDIAFSLAVLRLLGPRVPGGLRVFLTALAIIDDLGAILIIAVFYTAHLNLPMLGGAAAVWLAMLGCNVAGVRGVGIYVAGFVTLWALLVQSGVHATLAGVATAFAVPLRAPDSAGRQLEHGLNGVVAFVILPLFALANAGLHVTSVGWQTLADPIVPGIALGLFLGKPLGVMGTMAAAIRLRLVALPAGLDWRLLYGASVLCGIGFTMSLFIGGLAFPGGDRATELRLAVFAASIASALLGAAVVGASVRRKTKAVPSHSEKGVSTSTARP